MNDDREKDKPSWRDRDAKNNKSPHATKEDQPVFKSSKDKRQETLAKKDLEELFKPKVSKEESKAWNAVLKLKGSEFCKSASSFVEKFGYPKEWGDLITLLDHSESTFVENLLKHMHEQLPQQTDTKKELFCGKLKVLHASCDDYQLSKSINSILSTEFPS